MIKYKSTRGHKIVFTFSEAILKGIATDGGLFVPERIPKFTLNDLKKLQNKKYAKIAEYVLNLFQPDFSKKEISEMTKKAYGKKFDNEKIAPLVHLKESQYLLELWHGPTSAFKDMALQLTPLLFAKAVEKNNELRRKKKQKTLQYFILVATSGDTGKAALEGYKNKKNVKIMVLFPHGKVSKLQELAMTTQGGNNTCVYAVSGNFDDTQRIVKEIFDDEAFNNKLLDNYQIALSSGNSINWGRFLPQVIYYISSYIDLVDQEKIKIGDKIDVVVPTGNFGNILAGFVAKKMGVPIRKLVCASNDNNVLTEFIQSGTYDLTKRKLIATASPSIDILVASNLERLLFLLKDNVKEVTRWMQELKTNKKFSIDEKTKRKLQQTFYSDWVSNADSLKNIKEVFDKTGYLMDTHTSVAQKVAQKYIEKQKITIPVIIHSTAHFAKFANAVYSSLFPLTSSRAKSRDLMQNKLSVLDPSTRSSQNFGRDDRMSEFEILKRIKKLNSKITIPRNIEDLQSKKILHKRLLPSRKDKIEHAIIQIVQSYE